MSQIVTQSIVIQQLPSPGLCGQLSFHKALPNIESLSPPSPAQVGESHFL